MTKAILGAVIVGIVLAVGNLDLASALTEEAIQKNPPRRAPVAAPPRARAAAPPVSPRRYWDVDEGRRAKSLRDCPANANIAISYNNGTGSPWKQFCVESAGLRWRTKEVK